MKNDPEAPRYTFTRSHRKDGKPGWTTRRRTGESGLTFSEAKRACDAYNADRSAAQIKAGHMMEFDRE